MEDQTEAQRLQLKVRLLQQEQIYDVLNDAPAHFESQGEESWVARYHRSLTTDNLVTSNQTTDAHDTYSIALDSMSSTIPNYIPPITLTPTIDTDITEPTTAIPITLPPIDDTPTFNEEYASIALYSMLP